MIGLIQEIVEWIDPAFSAAGYYIIGGAVLAERSVFLGLIVPGDVILALGGIYAARGDMSLALVILLAIFAAICGESIGYWLGRTRGHSVIRRLPFGEKLDDRVERAEDYFKHHGGKTVAVGRFATAVGAFIPFVAGVGGMPYRRFLLFDIPAVVVWATAIALVGYFFESQLDLVDKILSRFGWIMLGLVVAFIVGRILWKRHKEKSSSGSKSESTSSSRSG